MKANKKIEGNKLTAIIGDEVNWCFIARIQLQDFCWRALEKEMSKDKAITW